MGNGGGGGGTLGGGNGGRGLWFCDSLLVIASVVFCIEFDKDFSNGFGGNLGVVRVLGGSEGGICRVVGVDGVCRTETWIAWDLSSNMLPVCGP